MFKGFDTLLIIGLALGACSSLDDENDSTAEPVISFVEQGLHPSGVCRIESHTSWTEKVVKFYHISAPTVKYHETDCDLWVGTSECCSRDPYFELTYDQCVQLRHQPDCPVSGGGGDDNEDETDPL